jgi:hypothetical protein
MTFCGGNVKDYYLFKFAINRSRESLLAGIFTIFILLLKGINFFGIARLAYAVKAFYSKL